MALNDKFRRDIKRIVTKAKERNDMFVRDFLIDIYSRVVLKSPVRLGRFKGNWNIGYDSINYTTTDNTDKSGAASISSAILQIMAGKTDGIVYITNSLPYAQRLEYGYSQQAPAGVVRVTVEEMRSAGIRIGVEVKAL